MISFNTPCLRWKLIAALKLQVGWPGFIAPYLTRYLSKHVVITTIPSYGYGTPQQGPPQVRTQDFFMDHLGNVTFDPTTVDADADFPYTETLPSGPDESWTVTETQFTHVLNNGYTVTTTEVTLSNPYTIGQLDGDLDGLIAAIDVDTAPWNTLTINVSPDIGISLSDPNALVPAPYNYADFFHPGWQFPVPLRAAAYSACAIGQVGYVTWFPNVGVKVVGYLAMAGNYCLNTFFLDDNGNVLNQTCANGIGSCAGTFEVTPPPVALGTAAYIVLTPNGQCGG